jgi:hypothetical protein
MKPLHIENMLIKQTSSGLRMPRFRAAFSEHFFNFFECLSSRFWIREEGLDSGAEAKRPEDNEEFPRDIREGGRDEETDCEVEEPKNQRLECVHVLVMSGVEKWVDFLPVRNRRQGHSHSSSLERPDFGSVDPCNRGESKRVYEDKEVTEGDDSVGG